MILRIGNLFFSISILTSILGQLERLKRTSDRIDGCGTQFFWQPYNVGSRYWARIRTFCLHLRIYAPIRETRVCCTTFTKLNMNNSIRDSDFCAGNERERRPDLSYTQNYFVYIYICCSMKRKFNSQRACLAVVFSILHH